MDASDTYSRIIEIISEALDIDIEDLSEDTKFTDLNADSFDMLEMITAIEDEFDIEVSDSSLEGFRTVGDIVEALGEE